MVKQSYWFVSGTQLADTPSKVVKLMSHVVDADAAKPSRVRLIVFWVVAVVFLFLLLGDILQTRAWYMLVPFTIWGGWGEAGNYMHHSVHMVTVAVLHWAIIAAVAAQLVRPQQRIGAAWSYLILAGVTLAIALVVAELPPEAVPILIGVLVFAIIAFVVHPSAMSAKITPVDKQSPLLWALVAVAAIPLLVFAADQFAINAASGPGDEHWEFGHWTFMGIYPIVTILLGAVSALKFSGWRLPGWLAGIMVLFHALTSLIVPAASALSTLWAILALLWAIVFIGAIEREARRHTTDSTTTGAPAAA